MPFDLSSLMLFTTEIGVIALSIGALVFDTFVSAKADPSSGGKDNESKDKALGSFAMAGVGLTTALLCIQWGQFGSALSGSFVQDGVSFFFKLLFLLSAFFVLFMARQYRSQIKRGHTEFTLLILFALVGMTFVASANDFLLLFVALETLTVSFYVMTAYLRDKTVSIEAGLKYIILGALSTGIFLFGLSFIYGTTGSTHYGEIRAKLDLMPAVPAAFTFGMVLVTASLCFKIAAVPFHLWAPDVYEGAPTPVTAYLATGSKIAGFAALSRLLLTVFAPTQTHLTFILAILAALTIFYGNLGAIPQINLKRLLGYSSIGHTGYLLIGLAAFSSSGAEAVLIYLLSYVFSTAGVFLVLTTLSRQLKTDEISGLAGLSRRSPVLAAGMLLALLSLAGVPPLAGFFAKFYILWSGTQAGLLWLVAIGAIHVITSLYYTLKIVKVMYLEKPSEDSMLRVSKFQKTMQVVSITGILVLGIFQGPFVRLAELAFKNLIY